MTTATTPVLFTPPQLPTELSDLNLVIYGADGSSPVPPRKWWSRARHAKPSLLIDAIGQTSPIPGDIDEIALADFTIELEDIDSPDIDTDELIFESPILLKRDIGLSNATRATFAQLVAHRRTVAATAPTLCLPNRNNDDLLEDGYTLVHVATGLIASFVLADNGQGSVLAKGYSNPYMPQRLVDQFTPQFCGYGVGRRLYLAAHELWPDIRWQDNAVRASSKALRVTLHRINPYVWQDRQCETCQYNRTSWKNSTQAELRKPHR